MTMQSTIRRLAFLSLAALASTLSLQAQCLEPLIGPSVGTGDDIVLPMQALGFAFPFNGQTYTHIHPCTNGFVYLSNAGFPAPGGSGCCSGSTAVLVAGSPMVAPWWSDLYITGAGTVNFNALPGKAVVTWNDAQEYFSSPLFTVQLQLHATGEIDFVYDGRVQNFNGHQFLVGMSQGGGAAVPPASDFSVVGASATTTNYQLFSVIGPTSLTGKGVHFVPTLPGYVWVPTSCSASHTSYGTGCYTVSDSFYQLITSPAVAAATMTGTAITMIKAGNNYVVTNGGTYVPPTGAATVLALTDDSEIATPALTTPFPYVGGTAATLTVCSNGFVSMATGNTVSYTPNAATMLNSPQTAFWSWHDYNPSAGGQIKFEQVGGIAYVTWDGVYTFSGTTPAAANTLQFQFDESNGNVTIVWQTISSYGSTLPAGDPHLAGYSPGGNSNDPGSITFATALPMMTSSANMSALSLSAATAPISTPVIGTVVTYTTSNIPEFIPTSGLYIAMNIVSLGVIPAPGIDLGFLGAPGCAGLVASLDLTQAMVGGTATQTVTLSIPPGVAAGTQLYSQSVALFAPFSLPNGQNAFGMETSNGIASSVNSQ
jgi:hypothetical protein